MLMRGGRRTFLFGYWLCEVVGCGLWLRFTYIVVMYVVVEGCWLLQEIELLVVGGCWVRSEVLAGNVTFPSSIAMASLVAIFGRDIHSDHRKTKNDNQRL